MKDMFEQMQDENTIAYGIRRGSAMARKDEAKAQAKADKKAVAAAYQPNIHYHDVQEMESFLDRHPVVNFFFCLIYMWPVALVTTIVVYFVAFCRVVLLLLKLVCILAILGGGAWFALRLLGYV